MRKILFLMFIPFLCAGWWNNDWEKMKPCTLWVASGTPDSGYQVRAVVNYDADMQTDFDDIRWVDNDDATELSYWLEQKVDSDSAVYWVRILDSITTNKATVNMYYKNSGASSTASGSNTFLFFDDFETGNFSADWTTVEALWTVQSSIKWQGTYAAKGDEGATNRTLKKIDTLEVGAVRLWVKLQGNTKSRFIFAGRDANGNKYYLVAYKSGNRLVYYNGSAYVDFPTATSFTVNTWFMVDIAWNYVTDSFDFWKNGVKKSGNGIPIPNPSATNLYFRSLTATSQFGEMWLDNVCYRKYADPEPQYAFGPEQDKPTGPSGQVIIINTR